MNQQSYQIKSPLPAQHQNSPHSSKIKKDRIFILVLCLLIASLSYDLLRTLYMMSIKHIVYSAVHVWLLVFVDIIAIIGAFWLLRSYRRTLRLQKKQEQDRLNQEKLNKEVNNNNV